MSPAASAYAWRAAGLSGLVAGLALAAPAGRAAPISLAAAGALALLLAVARPRPGNPGWMLWLVLVAIVAAFAGLSIASARLSAIDSGRLAADPGSRLTIRGTVSSPPRRSGELTRFALDTQNGRIAVETSAPKGSSPAESTGLPPLGAIDEGRVLVATGTFRDPAEWERSQLERAGASMILVAESLELTREARGGLRGALDDVRRRAEAALERGTGASGAALLRGFVLGQDDRIPEEVREDFRRSGLAHVLAVSGQNVMLLAILATPLLALVGVPLRARLVAIAVVIAIYVPVAGAGASIQRAGVMGLAGLVAVLASRPSARWYALGLAAAVTLTIDPRATADIGWQLSFAAVAGLLVLSRPLIELFGGDGAGLRRGFAEGAAMTIAATIATAPLAAHHFGTVSVTAIPANLVALPAVAPAMWLGMLSGALGQIPGAPVEPLSWLGGLCAGFIGWVAHALGPHWAQLDVPEPGPLAALAWAIAMLGSARLGCLALQRRQAMRPLPRRAGLAAFAAATISFVLAALALDGFSSPQREARLTIRVLDVGQGDAILIEPRGHPPLLVDTGPPGADVGARLAENDIETLSVLAITHDDLDHSGGLAGVLERVDADRLVVGDRVPASCRFVTCPPVTRAEAGDAFRVGPAKVEVAWPLKGASSAEIPNETSLVLHVSAGEFDALLTGDAEAEVARYGPGPVDLLKVAHHGSADAGLASLLDRTGPQLAVISVGSGNPFGHPALETTSALSEHGVPTLRTDEVGEIVIEVERDSWRVATP